MSMKARDPKIRFWEKVQKSDSCWNWVAGKFSNGYGQFFDGVKKIGAHRFSYIIHNGEIESNLVVCHHCDNPSCVNPNHLFLGSQADNIGDMIKKGRKNNADNRGSKNPRARLTQAKADQIRKEHKTGKTIASLAREYSVGESTVRHIIQGNTWINKR